MKSKALYFIFVFASQLAFGQATRTWVSGVGDDANPCSRTAPCKTFAGAISKTAAGGEISVLDPGGFGGVTITKSITLNGEGTLASILVSGTNGITINAASTDKITLNNISFHGVGTGLYAINFIAGQSLTIENCNFNRFTKAIVNASRSTDTASVYMNNSQILNTTSTSKGIDLSTSGTGFVKAIINNSSFNDLDSAFTAKNASRIFLSNSLISGNKSAVYASDNAKISIENCQINGNKVAIKSIGSSEINLSNSSVINNTTGISSNNVVISFGNNRIRNNGISAPLGVLSTE